MAAKDKNTKPDSKPQKSARVSEQAARAGDQERSSAGAGAQAPAIDAPPEHKPDAEAVAARPTASGKAAETTSPEVAAEALTFSFPLPANIAPSALTNAWIIVTSKAATGRRRAGMFFTRDETTILYGDLGEEQITALTRDAHLVVSMRIPKLN
jgi:hypothetical protein